MSVIALGYFDGVHTGHAALLRKTRLLADEYACRAAALTFDRPPAAFVTGQGVPQICTLEDRIFLMKNLFRMDEVLVERFDEALRQMPWEQFAREVLLEKYKATALVCGRNFRFGKGGEGTPEKLAAFAEKNGCPLTVVEDVQIEGQTVSSTAIRKMLRSGETEKALRFLGHPLLLGGTVVVGQKLGRMLGSPTANTEISPALILPAPGVYAAKVTAEGKDYIAVTNIGVHPTVGAAEKPLAESWLLDFGGDLYGKKISVWLYARLRGEQKFSSTEELVAQIHSDAEQTKAYFANK